MNEDSRPPTITVYRDGPYLVRGPVTLCDQDGNELAVGARTVALCRCGRSAQRPFCDGTHKVVRFRAPGTSEAPLPGTVTPELP